MGLKFQCLSESKAKERRSEVWQWISRYGQDHWNAELETLAKTNHITPAVTLPPFPPKKLIHDRQSAKEVR